MPAPPPPPRSMLRSIREMRPSDVRARAASTMMVMPRKMVRVGIRFKPTNRFGLFGCCKLRFPQINNRSVCHRIKNRRVRCRFRRFGFSVPPNQPRRAEEQINRENGEREKNKSTRKGRRCRALRCPHRRNPARRSRLRAPSSPIRLPGAAARRAAAHAATDSPSLASCCRRPRLLIHRKPPTAAACHRHSPMRARRPQLLPEPMRGFPPQPLPPRCALTDRPQ